jgi:di/tricarboxylate transporter
MTSLQVLLIIIVAIPLAFVLIDRLRMDIAALIIAASLGIAQFFGLGILGPADSPADAVKAISGFGQPIVVTLLGLFIISRGLDQSGVARWIARKLMFLGGTSEKRLIGLFATTTAFLSIFMNNLAAGALLLPSAMETARRTGIKPSKLLIPVAYGSLLGGVATYFTTANIIVSDLLQIAKPPQGPLSILDFLPTGGLIAVAGIILMVFLGTRLLPDRKPAPEQMLSRLTGSELEDIYQLRDRLWEARLLPDSSLVGKTLAQAKIGQTLGVEVVAIWRGRQAIFSPTPEQNFHSGDILLLVGREERVEKLKEEKISIGREAANGYISPYGVIMLEILLAPHSNAEGHTLKDLDFRRLYGFTAVALRRLNQSYRTNVGDFKLTMGDTLLVVGSEENVKNFQKTADFIVLEPSLSDQPINRQHTLITVSVVLAAISASIIGFPIYLAILIGAVVVVLSGILSMEEAYRSIEWQAIFLIAGMFAVSLAMVETGLARLLGNGMVQLVTPFGPLGLAAGAYILSAILTQLMGG